MEDKDAAYDFINALDPHRYSTFIAEVVNDISKGVMLEPSDLSTIYVLMTTRVTTNPSR